jgi:hypothetical protein
VATGSVLFTPAAAVLPDSGAPAITRRIGTEASTPKKVYLTADFDPTTDESLWFPFAVPANYASGGDVDLFWMTGTTTGICRWGTAVGCVSPGDVDTPVEHAWAAASTAAGTVNATEARRLTLTTITLANLDGMAAGDVAWLLVYRDADATSGTDSLTVDAELIAVRFTYTTA